MTEETRTDHCTFDELIEYHLGRLPESETLRLENHISCCDPCAVRSSRIFQLDHLFDDWKQHVAPEAPGLADIVSSTLADLRIHLLGALGVRYDEAGFAVLPTDLGGLAFAAEGRTRGSIPTRGSAPARKSDLQLSATGESGVRISVEADGRDGSIKVRLEGWPSASPPPALLVISTKPGDESQSLPWRRQNDVYFVESVVEPGAYALVFTVI